MGPPLQRARCGTGESTPTECGERADTWDRPYKGWGVGRGSRPLRNAENGRTHGSAPTKGAVWYGGSRSLRNAENGRTHGSAPTKGEVWYGEVDHYGTLGYERTGRETRPLRNG